MVVRETFRIPITNTTDGFVKVENKESRTNQFNNQNNTRLNQVKYQKSVNINREFNLRSIDNEQKYNVQELYF